MEPPWERGPDRAEKLLTQNPQAGEVLSFYQSLLVFQQSLFDSLAEAELSAAPSRDFPVLMTYLEVFLDWASDKGPTLLSSQGREIAGWDTGRQRELIFAFWRGEESAAGNFFPKAFLQPYAAFLAAHGKPVQERPLGKNLCPFCGAAPQASYRRSPPSILSAGSEGASRYLICSLCFTDWPVNRISCAHCDESDPYKLPYYSAEQIPVVRVEACDTCKYYIKGVDLTKDGLAVPLVDEIATPALDLWAQEHEYQKIELNLAGI